MKRALFWLSVAIVAAPFVGIVAYIAYHACKAAGWWSIAPILWLAALAYASPGPRPPCGKRVPE